MDTSLFGPEPPHNPISLVVAIHMYGFFINSYLSTWLRLYKQLTVSPMYGLLFRNDFDGNARLIKKIPSDSLMKNILDPFSV